MMFLLVIWACLRMARPCCAPGEAASVASSSLEGLNEAAKWRGVSFSSPLSSSGSGKEECGKKIQLLIHTAPALKISIKIFIGGYNKITTVDYYHLQ